MVKTKICGITNLEDAKDSIAAGCDALGFVFYKKSPRYISCERAKKIISVLANSIIKIGVFVNAQEKEIRRIAKACKLNILQFHGEETPRFCARFKGFKVIKAFKIKNRVDINKILEYNTFAYLFDTFSKLKKGGTGKRFNWKLLRNLQGLKQQIFLSGGLTADNVSEAIKIVRPDWLDVSSSVEDRPGKKDRQKVRRFLKAIKPKGR